MGDSMNNGIRQEGDEHPAVAYDELETLYL